MGGGCFNVEATDPLGGFDITLTHRLIHVLLHCYFDHSDSNERRWLWQIISLLQFFAILNMVFCKAPKFCPRCRCNYFFKVSFYFEPEVQQHPQQYLFLEFLQVKYVCTNVCPPFAPLRLPLLVYFFALNFTLHKDKTDLQKCKSFQTMNLEIQGTCAYSVKFT
ncbi:hypothetical protein BDF20DRAFT_984234 [Mycotypha africana]|uniref:uncharacterized protein n=1 Tax=Mycotypha africana TaxID=64632 RepID=UPI00230028BE|nr:uncharacterized protein BDF20DRAFT_984234 [Mycotypha africana]KAI8991595.1 hypothetical protein BDF20DRAFT_984234 [Mycotypha africana]